MKYKNWGTLYNNSQHTHTWNVPDMKVTAAATFTLSASLEKMSTMLLLETLSHDVKSESGAKRSVVLPIITLITAYVPEKHTHTHTHTHTEQSHTHTHTHTRTNHTHTHTHRHTHTSHTHTHTRTNHGRWSISLTHSVWRRCASLTI